MRGTFIVDPRVKVSKYDGVPGNDAFSVAGVVLIPAPLAVSIDPVTRGVRAQISVPGRAFLLDVILPPGAYDPETREGWCASKSGLTWKFRSKDPSLLANQARVRISDDDPAEVRVKLTGKRLSFAEGVARSRATAGDPVGGPQGDASSHVRGSAKQVREASRGRPRSPAEIEADGIDCLTTGDAGATLAALDAGVSSVEGALIP